MNFLFFRAFFKMANPVVYEIKPHQVILVDPSNQCGIRYDRFGEEDTMPDHIETVHEGKEANKNLCRPMIMKIEHKIQTSLNVGFVT